MLRSTRPNLRQLRVMVPLGLVVLLAVGLGIAHATVDFNAGFESGSASPWPDLQYQDQLPKANSFQIVTDPVRSGKYAAKFVVAQGYSPFGYGESTELCCGATPHETQGSDYWYGWSTLFPANWVEPYHWGIFAQWHASNGMPPPISLDAGANDVSLVIRTGALSQSTCDNSGCGSWAYDQSARILTTLSKGQWNDFVLHIKFSSSSNGSVEVWHRLAGQSTFTKVFSQTSIPTLQSYKGSTYDDYFKLGLYRASYCAQPTKLNCTSSLGVQPTSTLYHDSFVRGTSFDEVVATAWGGSAGAVSSAVSTSTPAAPSAPSAPAAPSAPSASTSTFGITSVGSSLDQGGNGYLDTSGPYSLSTSAKVSKLTGYIVGEPQALSVRGVIYADAGGKPGSLAGVTSAVTIAAGAKGAWVDLPFSSPVGLGSSGKYWLGYWYGPGARSGGGGFAWTNVSGSEAYAPASFSSSGSPPGSFPSAKSSSSQYSLYATFAVPAAPAPAAAPAAPAATPQPASTPAPTVSKGKPVVKRPHVVKPHRQKHVAKSKRHHHKAAVKKKAKAKAHKHAVGGAARKK